jgi:hypothetical protein
MSFQITLFFIQNRTLLVLYSSEDTYSSLAVGDVVVVGVGRGEPDAVATFTVFTYPLFRTHEFIK